MYGYRTDKIRTFRSGLVWGERGNLTPKVQENSNAWSESCVAAKKRRTERRGSSPAGLFDQGKSGIWILRVLLELVPPGESARLNDLRTLQKETPPKKGLGLFASIGCAC